MTLPISSNHKPKSKKMHATSPAASGAGRSVKQAGANCDVCAERGFVTKTPTPHFPPRQVVAEPPRTCHGCVERAAILAEVAALREMVLSLSHGVLELNDKCAGQVRRIATLERELQLRNATAPTPAPSSHSNLALQNLSAQQQSAAAAGLSGGGHGGAAAPTASSTQLTALVERMLANSMPAMEARILVAVRAAETERTALELRSAREDAARKIAEVQRDVDRHVTELESRWAVTEKQLRETIASHDRRVTRTFFQLCQAVGIAVPASISGNGGLTAQHHEPTSRRLSEDTFVA
jgi:hypothetical protein